jgi:hypothetical protein
MKSLRVFLVLCLILLCSSCSPFHVTYDYDAEADFTPLKTFDWMAVPAQAQVNELVIKRVKSAVTRELESKGIKKVSENPDFLIALHGGKERKVEIQDWGYTYGHHRRYWDNRRIDIYEYEEGTLILDIVGAESRELIWRGSATGVIDPNPTPEQRGKRVDEVVAKILENFPPAP